MSDLLPAMPVLPVDCVIPAGRVAAPCGWTPTLAQGDVVRISIMSLSVHWSIDFVFQTSPPAKAIAAAARIDVPTANVFMNLSFQLDIPTTKNCTSYQI